MPKVEAIKKRLGSLADEFKELVYPPGYNPEGKVAKRKPGKGWVWIDADAPFKAWSLWSYHTVIYFLFLFIWE